MDAMHVIMLVEKAIIVIVGMLVCYVQCVQAIDNRRHSWAMYKLASGLCGLLWALSFAYDVVMDIAGRACIMQYIFVPLAMITLAFMAAGAIQSKNRMRIK